MGASNQSEPLKGVRPSTCPHHTNDSIGRGDPRTHLSASRVPLLARHSHVGDLCQVDRSPNQKGQKVLNLKNTSRPRKSVKYLEGKKNTFSREQRSAPADLPIIFIGKLDTREANRDAGCYERC